jgi:hypothetical protein
LIVTVVICVCPAITLGVYETRPEFSIEKLGAVCVSLPEYVGRSLLRHPTNRSRAINGSSTVKVIRRLG